MADNEMRQNAHGMVGTVKMVPGATYQVDATAMPPLRMVAPPPEPSAGFVFDRAGLAWMLQFNRDVADKTASERIRRDMADLSDGHPHKITWADVDRLRDAIAYIESENGRDEDELRALADKLSALLRPA